LEEPIIQYSHRRTEESKLQCNNCTLKYLVLPKESKVILRNIFVQITCEPRKRVTGFYILRQGVPEGRSSKTYASYKQVKPWPWHVEVIPGIGVAGLMTNNKLCQVAWGIVINNSQLPKTLDEQFLVRVPVQSTDHGVHHHLLVVQLRRPRLHQLVELLITDGHKSQHSADSHIR